MQGTRSHQLALIAVLLALGAGAAGADGIYDRKLEKAVKAIVAKKVDGPLRGSLQREWRSPSENNTAMARRTTVELGAQSSILTLTLLPASPDVAEPIDALRTGSPDTPAMRPTTGTASTGG